MIIEVIVLWVVALAFILVTLKNILVRAVKTRRCSAIVNGVISDVKEKAVRREGITSREYIPTVSYTVDSIEYNKRLAKVYHSDTYTIGQMVGIMYNPKRPSEIYKKGRSNKADIIILSIGVLIAVVGVVLLMI